MKQDYSKNSSIDEKITDAFLSKLKSGVSPAQLAFRETDFRELTSAHNGKPFSGVNRVLVAIAKHDNQLNSNGFITLKQASQIFGIPQSVISDVKNKNKPDVTLQSINHPLAGKSPVGFVVAYTPVYTSPDGEVKSYPSKDDIKSLKLKSEWVSYYNPIWSLDQISSFPEKALNSALNNSKEYTERLTSYSQEGILKNLVRDLIKNNDIKVVKGDTPHFDRDRDVIVMPPINSFVSDSSFLRTILHEIVHWTGHKDRLNRSMTPFSNLKSPLDGLAEEELVVELSTAFLCQKYGVDSFTSSNIEHHQPMMNPWISLLESDNKAAGFISNKAEKALDFLVMSLKREPVLSNDIEDNSLDI